MSKKFLVPIDLSQLEIQNVRMQNLATAPSSPVIGQFYFNTTTEKAMVWDGTDWIPWEIGASVSPATATPLMDGTAAVGASLLYARQDHVHPSDTSRVPTARTINGYNLTSNITIEADDIPVDATSMSHVTTGDVQNALEQIDGAIVGQSIWYGTSTTAAGTIAKAVATTSGDFVLATGARVSVKFTNAQSASTATLNVDGTGAKNVTFIGTTTNCQYQWQAGEVIDFVYDGTNYVMVNEGRATTTYYGVTKLSSATNSTSTSLAATPSAVKSAYDLANTANTAASNAYDLATTKSSVQFTQTQTTGTEVGIINIDGTTTSLYAPTPEQANWTETDTTALSYINNKPTLATVATTGSYTDLSNKPTLGTAAAKGVDTSISTGSTSTNLPTSKAVSDFVSSAIGAADAMRFKGTIGTGGTVTALPSTHQIGDTYRVITAGTYAGQTCEVGDLLIAMTTSGTTSSDWTVAQTNIDGALTGITAGTGISVTGSGNSRTVGLASGVTTATSVGDTSNQTPSFGGTFKAISQTVDTYGRTTATAEHTVKIPALPTASTSTAGIVQLNNTVTSTSTSQAGTANAVKTAYDKAVEALTAANNNAVQTVTLTIAAGSTSATTSAVTRTTLVDYRAYVGNDEVVLDAEITSSGCTFSIASAITSAITIIVRYA